MVPTVRDWRCTVLYGFRDDPVTSPIHQLRPCLGLKSRYRCVPWPGIPLAKHLQCSAWPPLRILCRLYNQHFLRSGSLAEHGYFDCTQSSCPAGNPELHGAAARVYQTEILCVRCCACIVLRMEPAICIEVVKNYRVVRLSSAKSNKARYGYEGVSE